jgi:hypothetical protein
MVVDRKGSVGGEVMKRFTVVLIKKQSNVLKRTGIIVHLLVTIKVVLRSSKWLQWVQETVRMETVTLSSYNEVEVLTSANDFKYKFQLKPIYEIAYVRPNSSSNCRITKGDVIITINYNPTSALYKRSTLF